MQILLAEDNAMVQEMMVDALELFGYEVILAGDGYEAIEKAHAILPALILMDMSMPEMDGWEASRRLKSDPKTQHIPILAVTAHAVVGEREKALDAGCDGYISKPVQLATLIDTVKQMIGESNAS